MVEVMVQDKKKIFVANSGDISLARKIVRELGERVGFDSALVHELVLVAGELASNLIRHADHGEMSFTLLGGEEKGIELETLDDGPGIPDIEIAMTDGVTSGTSLGYGLGSINRIMDFLEVHSPVTNGRGTRICSRKYLPVIHVCRLPCPLSVGVTSRPFPGMRHNGDSFIIKHFGCQLLVGVIDGLGHGKFAYDAAQRARQYVEKHYDQPFERLFQGTGRACRSTRGVVMALVKLDWSSLPIKMTFGSIGNIDARLWHGNAGSLPVRRGIIGKNAPSPKVHEQSYDLNDTLFLFSDGITSHWQMEKFLHLQTESAGEMARIMLEFLAKDDDDATLLIVKSSRSETLSHG